MTDPVPTARLREELNPQRLLDSAVAEAGLSDFGGQEFLEAMKRFLDAAVSEGSLNETGLLLVKSDTTRFLVNRLRFRADLEKHPEILHEDVSGPIVVTGLPRTGTSKLQRMMSADPTVQKLLTWRLLNPGRIPGVPDGEPDPRIAIGEGVEGLLENFPEFQAAHPTRAAEVDEDLMLHEMTFESVVLTFRVRMPSYLAWVRNRPARHVYDYAKTVLQYLQWQDGGRRDRPWVLKTPVHIAHLDDLIRCFPDATIVHCHRDPITVLPSFARAVQVTRSIATDNTDPREVGEEQLDIWSEAVNRNLDLREELKTRADIVDVPYDLIHRDPHTAIDQIYRGAGRRIEPDMRAEMDRWDRDNPQNRFGKHRYSLEEYGLSPERIDQAFARYLDRFATHCGRTR